MSDLWTLDILHDTVDTFYLLSLPLKLCKADQCAKYRHSWKEEFILGITKVVLGKSFHSVAILAMPPGS